MNHRRWLTALTLTLVACGQGSVGSDAETTTSQLSQPDTTTSTAATTTSVAPASDSTVTTTIVVADPGDDDDGGTMPEPLPGEGPVPDDYVRAVLADAAERTGIAPVDLEVARAEAVTWRDGSLGCPEPGMSYTQALVPGYWVEIRAGETILDYRLNAQGAFRLCESAGLVVPDPFHKGDPVDPGS